jgi:putative ABC transport system permease protein
MHNFLIEGRPTPGKGEAPEIFTRDIAGDYFGVMQIPIIRGRSFTDQDNTSAPLVGILNQTAVRRYFPGQDPIGARVRWAALDDVQWITIVGIAGDVKHFGLDLPEDAALYTPFLQTPSFWKRWMRVVVKSDATPAALTEMIKNQVWKLDKQLPVTQIQTMTEIMATSLAKQRFNMTVLGIFAAVALLLAAVGIYGVISYSVAQRTHEIGIRMALGAQSEHVMKMVVREGLILALFGVAIGITAAYALTRFMSSLLFGVGVTDLSTFVAVAIALTGVAILASYIPARRASKVDPMVALRYE